MNRWLCACRLGLSTFTPLILVLGSSFPLHLPRLIYYQWLPCSCELMIFFASNIYAITTIYILLHPPLPHPHWLSRYLLLILIIVSCIQYPFHISVIIITSFFQLMTGSPFSLMSVRCSSVFSPSANTSKSCYVSSDAHDDHMTITFISHDNHNTNTTTPIHQYEHHKTFTCISHVHANHTH